MEFFSQKDYLLAKKLSDQLKCPLLENPQSKKTKHVLFYKDDILHWSHHKYQKSFSIDFKKTYLSLKAKKTQNLFKAIGFKKNLKVLDLTAGWAQDALLMHSLGVKVTCVERFTPLYFLLEDALKRVKKDESLKEVFKDFKLIFNDSFKVLKSLDEKYDVIYLDPLFFDSSKSLAKKQIEVLKDSCKKDKNEVLELLKESLKKNINRLVLKRGLKQEILLSPKLQFKGHSVRYDVYLSL